MAGNDRSVGLSDLAARARSGAPSRQRNACRNPECRDGMTPGLVAIGGGNKGAPLFGAGGVGAKRLMRWSWVPCLACNAPDDSRRAGAVYRHLGLSEGEIARRAQLANTKAPYQPQEKDLRQTTLGRPGQPAPSAAPSQSDGRLTEMIEQNKQLSVRIDEMLKQNAEMTSTLSRMTVQIAGLLEDNAKLREQLSKQPPAPTVSADRMMGTLTLPKKD